MVQSSVSQAVKGTHIKRTLTGAAGLLLALALGACSQSSTPAATSPSGSAQTPAGQAPAGASPAAEALQLLKAQSIAWNTCDPTIVPYAVITRTIGDRIQCADVKVPLDWNSPGRGIISVALLRVKAANDSKRQGSIFFNPGGPGGDGLLFGAIFGYLWNQADTSTETGAALKQLSDEYDLIGFSPRGTGQSSRLTCGSNELFSPEHYQSEDRSQDNINAMLRNARLVAEACLKNPITPYINTDQTARDLDLTRQLMNENTFNYIGYSYGTWLGAWYAKLFPTHTGRMLLDGNTAFADTFQVSFNAQPLGFERAFRDSALAYTARHPVFEMGNTKEEVYNIYDAFPGDVKLALQVYPNSIIQDLYSDFSIPDISVSLVGARGLSEVVKANPDLNTAADLAPLLSKHTYAANPDLDAAARGEALTLLGSYLSIINEETDPVELGYDNAVFNAVINNDSPWNQDPQFWINFGDQQAKTHPLIGGGYTETSAIYWTAPTTSKPATPANLPPILMLQNELDPATPREGALDALKSLPSAKMIFVDNEAQHTAFPYDTDCVDVQVAHYFLSGDMPADKFNVCPAKPLPGETQVYPVGDTYTDSNTVPAQSLSSQALGAQAAQVHSALGATPDTKAVLKILKDIIQRNAIKPLNQR